MTYQPPPPPPPPPPSSTPGGASSFDPKSVNPLDWVIIGIGAFLLIFSFFGYWTASAGPYSESWGGWHFSDLTFISWFAFIIGLASAGVVALRVFAPAVKLPLPAYVAAILGFLISLLLYIIGAFAAGPDVPDGIDVSFGAGFSQILSMIVVAAGAVVALMRAQQTNTALPGPLAGLPKIGK